MSWAHFSWLWTVEPIALILLTSLLIRIVTFNYRQVEILTLEMYTSVVKAQTFLQHVDREFEVMNTCAKSVKSIFLNFGRVYREIAEGGKTVDEAVKTARNTIPEDLRSNLSDIFDMTNAGGSFTSLEVDALEKSGPKNSTSMDSNFSRVKPDSTDTEDSGYHLPRLKQSARDVLSSTVTTNRSEQVESAYQKR